jgi:hypothetical protein
MKLNKKKLLLRVAIGTLGGIIGFFYWKFYGCAEGCAIRSNKYLITGYGFFLGYLFTSSFENLFIKDADQTSNP